MKSNVFLAPFSPFSKLFRRSVWKVRKMAMTFAPSSLSRGTLSPADVIVTSILPQRWGQGLTRLQVSRLYAGGKSTGSQADCFSPAVFSHMCCGLGGGVCVCGRPGWGNCSWSQPFTNSLAYQILVSTSWHKTLAASTSQRGSWLCLDHPTVRWHSPISQIQNVK